jgi:dihydroorotate dehydrogenase
MLYHSLLRPLLFRLPPETAHELGLQALSSAPGIVKRLAGHAPDEYTFGNLKRFGLSFFNPVGLAAGFDKDGIALQGLAALGFGHIEAGTVTYHPQPGNPRPRLFRLPEDHALINRAGFNNRGAVAFAEQVSKYRPNCILGVSIGKSKIVPIEDAVSDYLLSFETVYPVADYIAVNVSSPNTPGLRSLQEAEQLRSLLKVLQQRNRELSGHQNTPRPLLVKLSPDLSDQDLEAIVEVVQSTGTAGIIATNTTIARNHLQTAPERVNACGDGGLSGAPLSKRSCEMIAKLFRLTRGTIPLIGVGGIFNAQDAWDKITAGASLVQLYTGFIYEGPGIANEINRGLSSLLTREGFQSLDDAVGIRAGEFA